MSDTTYRPLFVQLTQAEIDAIKAKDERRKQDDAHAGYMRGLVYMFKSLYR